MSVKEPTFEHHCPGCNQDSVFTDNSILIESEGTVLDLLTCGGCGYTPRRHVRNKIRGKQ